MCIRDRHRFVTPAALFLALLAACSQQDDSLSVKPVSVPSPASGHVVGPRLSTGPEGTQILSWMERGASGASLRYAAISGSGFGPAGTVATDELMFVNWADLPSVTAIDSDHLVAHWLRYSADKTYSYDVVMSQSFDSGRTWSEPLSPHTDGTPTEHGFVSTYFTPDSAVVLWLDGRETPAGAMTLRSAAITSDGQRVQEHLVDDSVCDCCQTDIAVSSAGPIAVYRDRTADEIRDIRLARFVDGRWQPGERLYEDNWKIAGCPVNGPSIVARSELVAVAWFSAANDRPVVRVMMSRDGGTTFGEPVEIARGRIAGYVGLTLMDGDALAVSWVSRAANGSNTVNLRTVSPDGHLGPVVDVGQTSQLRVLPQIGWLDGQVLMAWTDSIDDRSILQTVRIDPERKKAAH